MLDAYKMVVVSGIASVIFLSGTLFYRYVFPKKKINPLILLLLISCLPLISIFRTGVYQSGDFTDHALATIEFYLPLTEGIFLPRETLLTCNGYTCPDFIFLYLTPHYLMSLFHFIGLSFIASEKALLILTFILSGIGMYLWLKSEFGKMAGFVGALFYQFAPYHLVDLHFRTDVGELVCFALLPFCFLSVKKVLDNKNTFAVISLCLLIGFLILSHQVISLVGIPLLLLYGLIIGLQKPKRTKAPLLLLLLCVFYGVLLTAFYWIPIIVEKKIIAYGVASQISFVDLSDLLFSPYRFGFLFQGHHGELSHLIGYSQLFVVISAIILLINKKVRGLAKIYLVFFLLLFLLFFLMMQPITTFIWKAIPLLGLFTFTYRLLLFEALFTAVIAACITKYIPLKYLIILCLFTVFSTILNWGNRQMIPQINDKVLIHQSLTQNAGKNGITIPIWVKGDYYWQAGRVKTPLQIVKGKATIKELQNGTSLHDYIIAADTNTTFMENTFYFPGWHLLVDNRSYPFTYTTTPNPGTMKFTLKKGLYEATFQFTDTIDRTIGEIISGAALFLLILFVIWRIVVRK